MEFNSQVCTTKIQSQRLLDLGLKPETADMEIEICKTDYSITGYVSKGYWESEISEGLVELIPAWSLHRLLFLYRQDYTIKEVYNDAEECYGMLISAIEIAIENDEFNKEYLKQ